MGSILKGLGILFTSGVLLEPATIVGIGIAVWLLFFENKDDSYLLITATIIPYWFMAYSAIVLALFSKRSRVADRLNFKSLVGTIFVNFLKSVMSFFIFIALINFMSVW